MPLDHQTRKHVVDYILRDIVPSKIKPRTTKPIDWFTKKFAFISDEKLRSQLGEAFYQARYLGRFKEALNLTGGFNHAFTKGQIQLYASIYEAVIDWVLEYRVDDKIVKNLLIESTLKEQKNALGSKTSILYVNDDSGNAELILCRKGTRTKKLREIQFDSRVDAAVQLGFVDPEIAGRVKEYYKSRNAIHLQAAASKDFRPDEDQSSTAFRDLFRFLEKTEKYMKTNTSS